jgi:hypothetical protein
MARTCRALKEPALEILWKDLDSVLPLIGLFPANIMKRARRPGLGLVSDGKCRLEDSANEISRQKCQSMQTGRI